jgi:hypothetical protein
VGAVSGRISEWIFGARRVLLGRVEPASKEPPVSFAQEIRSGISEIGVALRRPEEFTVRWRDRKSVENAPRPMVFAVLLANAIVGLAAYGLTMGLAGGPGSMVEGALKAPLAAGIAWTVALPALYIINSSLGSKLDWSTTLLAALATVSFGALAMLAGVPIAWFFTVAVPDDAPRVKEIVSVLVHVVTFTGVAICMVDVFMRTMRALEPERSRIYAFLWLTLVGVIGTEMMIVLRLFRLTA